MGKQRIAQCGFTLVELLVALFVFALLSAFAFRATSGLSRSGEAVRADMAGLLEVQKAVALWERDVRQAAPRSIKLAGESAGEQLGLLDFQTRTAGPLAGQYVRYILKNGGLYRQVGQGEAEEVSLANPLLQGVGSLQMQAVGQEDGLPEGLEMILDYPGLGSLHRVVAFDMAEADPDLNTLVGYVGPSRGPQTILPDTGQPVETGFGDW